MRPRNKTTAKIQGIKMGPTILQLRSRGLKWAQIKNGMNTNLKYVKVDQRIVIY